MKFDEIVLHAGTWGYVIAAIIIFAESGILAGFFLPGDTLLFALGFLAAQNKLNILILLPLLAFAAITGDSTGYYIGKKYGKKLFNKPDSRFFHRDNLIKTEEFYQKYGKITIILARFVPVVRTFAPVIAGVGEMPYKTFVTYNIIGGILWACGVTLLGYIFGQKLKDLGVDIDAILLPIILVVMVISIGSALWHARSKPSHKKDKLDEVIDIID
jgi:membrane-associated protein